MTTAVATAPATTFVELWDEVKTEALNAWAALKTDVVAIEHTIVPVIEADLVAVLSQLKGIAVQMVMTLATQEFQNLTGAQKNVITTQSILNMAVALGKPIAQQDAQMLAQQAFNAVAAGAKAVQ